MSHKYTKRRGWILALFALSLVSILALAQSFILATPSSQNRQAISDHTSKRTSQSKTVSQTYRGLPTNLKIPAINVDTSVEYTGLTAKGDMTPPGSPTTVGWYKYGAIPGENGSSVMAGHVVGPKGQPAVFARLKELKKGDLLLVTDAKKQVVTFAVRDIRIYNQQQQHDDVFNSGPGTHLNIITCAGEWDRTRHHYLERLVVFADMSTSPS